MMLNESLTNQFKVDAKKLWHNSRSDKVFSAWVNGIIREQELFEGIDYLTTVDERISEGKTIKQYNYYFTDRVLEKLNNTEEKAMENAIDNKFTVKARDVWETLEVKKPFSDWIYQKIDYLNLEENVDYLIHYEVNQIPHKGGFRHITLKEYYITDEVSKKIGSKAQTKKGIEIRQELVTAADAFMEIKNNPDNMFEDMINANPSHAVSTMLKILDERSIILEKKIEHDRPKVEFAENVADTKDSVYLGDFCKVLKPVVGRNNFFAFLRDLNYLDNSNNPYQKYIDAGYFKVKESVWKDSNNDTHISFTTLLTGKGQLHLERKWREANSETEIKVKSLVY